jgi:3-deoxy-manno-octulosonate cytidylyltransferase (CMP-KDO synthetase)
VPVSLPFSLTEASVVAIIPARYQSSRLPGKPLADIAGRPMIEHVYRRAASASRVAGVIDATDDHRVADVVRGFGGAAWMTRPDHATGTDRLAEVAAALPCRLIVNLQGDEPLIDPAAIDAAIEPMLADRALDMSTIARPLTDPTDLANPNAVKVVTTRSGRALYFSRAPIPFVRGAARVEPLIHMGLYVYRREVLLRLASLPPTPLEQTESLEQLRALEHGIAIFVARTSHVSTGVDTPEDLERVRQHLLAASRG